MRLLIKQRVFSWTDTYDVYDEWEQVKYFVKADFFSLGHQIRVYDRNDREVGCIREKLLSFLPAFEVEQNGVTVGTVQKRFSFFKPRYEVDYKGWRVEGDFLGWDYEVYDGCSVAAHISQKPLHWGDTYVIECADGEDELACLLLVVAIDAANCEND